MFQNILVPVDLQDAEYSKKAIEIAVKEAESSNGQLHLITVLPGFANSYVSSFLGESEHNTAVKNVAKQLRDFAHNALPDELTPTLKVFEGSAAEEINRYAKDAAIDLIVIRAHQRSKLNEFLLGSVSARVVERAICSVFVLKN